ncbi:hypothetical protein MAUB_11090 [Mycolicibacterium aubagnense]|uniref:Uncharacterized protein n=1 Tax=Mycolicibacterium aubagnense TaxID=319707 RepID=A0ABN5YN49_9MYCO|nr:hypothetical protein MAUB_11090 [Mycolicibacterium aubagnense]
MPYKSLVFAALARTVERERPFATPLSDDLRRDAMSDFALYVGGVFALIVAAGLPYQGKTWYSRWSANER